MTSKDALMGQEVPAGPAADRMEEARGDPKALDRKDARMVVDRDQAARAIPSSDGARVRHRPATADRETATIPWDVLEAHSKDRA